MKGSSPLWSIVFLIAVRISAHMTTKYKPVFLMHGVTTNSSTLDYLTKRISQDHPGTVIHNSNAYPDELSYTSCYNQIHGQFGEEFLNFSKSYPGGFHLIGYSQGGILCRGAIEIYNNHNVVNFIAISAPLAGYYGPVMLNNVTLPRSTAYLHLYNPVTQNDYSVSNYFKDPHHHCMYLKYNHFLPEIDNEIRTDMSENYKRGFTKCNKIIMIGGPDDGVICPWQSSYFSFYDESMNVKDIRNTEAYRKDWFGLKRMDKRGKLIIHLRSGINHTTWVQDDGVINEYILPYLLD